MSNMSKRKADAEGRTGGTLKMRSCPSRQCVGIGVDWKDECLQRQDCRLDFKLVLVKGKAADSEVIALFECLFAESTPDG
jgi:hypothetical protein